MWDIKLSVYDLGYVYLSNLHILFSRLFHLLVGARHLSVSHQAWRYSSNKALNTPTPSWTVTEQWILRLSVRCRFTLRERLYKAFLTPEYRGSKSWISDATLAQSLHFWKCSRISTGAKKKKEALYPKFLHFSISCQLDLTSDNTYLPWLFPKLAVQ